MDATPPAPGKPDFVAVAVSGDLDPAWHLASPPPSFPAEPARLFQAFDGVADCPPTASGVDGDCLVGREAYAPVFLFVNRKASSRHTSSSTAVSSPLAIR